jgi:ATP-dependent Clp protease ATP-binding subunit ClpX
MPAAVARPVASFIPPLTVAASPSLKTKMARRRLSFSASRSSAPHRSQLLSNGHVGEYIRDEPLRGPLGNREKQYPKPEFYPKKLKGVVDQYVVGQERAKKTICSTIFNHYQNLRRREYLEIQAKKERERLARQMKAAQEEDAFKTYNEYHEGGISEVRPDFIPEMVVQEPEKFLAPEKDVAGVKIDKSNLLLIGPTGVGKTYILE